MLTHFIVNVNGTLWRSENVVPTSNIGQTSNSISKQIEY